MPLSNKDIVSCMPKLRKSYSCYILLLAVHIGLVWFLPYFPTQDGPSHIYNLVILHDLINGGREWGSFFTYQLEAVPNLGFNIIAYPLLNFFSPLVVEKIFISIYILLMGVSVPIFLRTFDRHVLPIAYFVFPVIFNFTLLMGFYSYAMAVPIFILAFSLSWKIRNRSASFRFVYLNLLGFILFYFHLIPFIFFMISLVAVTLAESAGYKRKINNFSNLLIIIFPSILNLFFYLRQGAGGTFLGFSYLFSFSRLIELIVDLSFFSTVNFLPWQLFPASFFIFLILLFSYTSIKEIFQRWKMAGDIQASEKALIYMILFLGLIYIFAPFNFGGGSYFNQRFPWVILLILLPLLQVPKTIFFKRYGQIVIAGIASIFFAFSAVIFWQQNIIVQKFLGGMNAGLPKGAFIMTYKRANDSESSRVDVLLHAGSYYGLYKKCVDAGNYETSFPYFPVHFKNTLPAFPTENQISYEPENINWSDYPSIQYIIGWEVERKESKKLSKSYHIVWEEGPVSIWQRINDNES